MTNDELATSIRITHHELVGYTAPDEAILTYLKVIHNRLIECMNYAEDCEWRIHKLKEINDLPRV